jgi:hypothetical protein
MFIILLIVLLSSYFTYTTGATIRNDIPRLDQYGHIVNAHDGSVVFFNGTYFMYGTVYENCTQPGSQCANPCGYTPNTYALYTSVDLESWSLQSTNILPDMDKDNHSNDYWMPVVGRRNDGKYVMQFWSTHCGFKHACTEVAFSDTPYGPFQNITQIALQGGTPSSQMGFFVDDDGAAYVKYNTVGPDQHHSVEKLSDDWMSSTGEYAILLWKPSFAWMEGGGMFKYGQLYYYMTGTDCCFCTWGGSAHFWSSYSPLGPWHPGVAPPLPTAQCDLTGNWQSIHGSPDSPTNENLTLTQQNGSNNFTFTDKNGQAQGWIDQSTGYVTFPPSAGDERGVVTNQDGTTAGCDRIRWYGYESFIWCRVGVNCTTPSLADSPQLNFCQDGSLPDESERLNPCDPGVEYGTNFTVPAQQFNVITTYTIDTVTGSPSRTILYYGERANSAPDHLFSHNFQAWTPLSFDPSNGRILPLTFPPSFQLNLTNSTG